MKLIDHILSKYIGLSEKSQGSSPTILGWIQNYFPKTKDDGEVPYCSIGMIEVFKELGLPLPKGVNPSARSWIDHTLPKDYKPKYGDVVIFGRTDNPNLGHIAIYLRTNVFKRVFHLGFNQGNSCSIDDTAEFKVVGWYNKHNV